MNKYEKKLRKIKGLYEMLNEKSRKDAEQQARSVTYDKNCTIFHFDYNPDYASIELWYWKYVVNYWFLDKRFHYGNASGVNDAHILELFWGSEYKGFVGCPRFHDNLQSAIKFVRNALKNGIDSMNYGTYTETVRLTNYLDFEEKEIITE